MKVTSWVKSIISCLQILILACAVVLGSSSQLLANPGEDVLKSIIKDENASRTVKRRAEQLLEHKKNEENSLLEIQLKTITEYLKGKDGSTDLIKAVLDTYDQKPEKPKTTSAQLEPTAPVAHSELIEEKAVNLRFCPRPRAHAFGPESDITIGDLHGNSMKFLYFLIREGIVTLGDKEAESDNRYKTLYEIYLKGPEVGLHDLKQFSEILEHAKVKSKNPRIRLVGDEFADRGSNDIFTIKIMGRLKKENLHFEVMISNHGLEFINWYEEAIKKENKYRFDMVSSGGQRDSLKALRKILSRLPVDETVNIRKEIVSVIDGFYMPNLKFLSYSRNQDKSISFYSHAPVGFELFGKDFDVSNPGSIKVSEECKIPDKSADLFTRCIDKLNEQFETIKHKDGIFEAAGRDQEPGSRNLLRYVTWHKYDRDMPPFGPLKDGTVVDFCHGHDGGGEAKAGAHDINLDNALGKRATREFDTQPYTIYRTVPER